MIQKHITANDTKTNIRVRFLCLYITFFFHVQSFFIYKCPSLVRFRPKFVLNIYIYIVIFPSWITLEDSQALIHSFIVVVIVIIIMNGAGRRYSSGQ